MSRSMRQLAWQWVLIGIFLMGGGTTSAWAQSNTFPANGNVGIGTTSPAVLLEVKGDDIRFTNSTGVGIVEISPSATAAQINANWYSGSEIPLQFGTSGHLMTMTLKSGNVGIGTTSPEVSLHILGGTGIEIDTPTRNKRVYMAISASSFKISTNYTDSDIPIILGTYGYSTNQLYLATTGNVGIGTTSPATKLHVAGDAQVDGNLAAKYQDVAEWVQASGSLTPGTVVVVDHQGHNQILSASQSYDTRVAGVVSAMPGLLLGEAGEDKVKVAQSGRVKVKVDAAYGPIAAGDLLVTSPTPGHAMRSSPVKLGETLIHRPGTLLGKALEPLEEGQGEILVLLTLQ